MVIDNLNLKLVSKFYQSSKIGNVSPPGRDLWWKVAVLSSTDGE